MVLDQKGNVLGEFDCFVKPNCIQEFMWMLEGHIIRPMQERVRHVNGICQVFKDWVNWVKCFLDNGSKKGVIVAWIGKACDLRRLYFLTEEIIKHYTSYIINPKHSGV